MKKGLAILWVLCLFLTLDVSAATEKVLFNGHEYQIFEASEQNSIMNMSDAKKFCESIGGHLATITTPEENKFLYEYIKSNNIQSAYFGLTDEENEGQWKWVTGENVEYVNWHWGEPNGESSQEDYAMFYWKFSDGTWNDGGFNSTINGGEYFICEWDNTYVASYYRSSENSTGKIELEWNESLLNNAGEYNHELATFAAGMSTMAYNNSESTNHNFHNAFEGLGFEDIIYTLDPDGDKSPYWLAHKEMDNDDGTEIVMVVIRGTKDKEWIDNFDAGTEITHKGFERAADYVYDGINTQIKQWMGQGKIEKGDKVKIFITGHSRGAAAANLVGKKLNDQGIQCKTISHEDIFVYTFATPNVTEDTKVSNEKYANIYNIVNPEDFVTKVLPREWGYGRYGITYVLPSKSTEKAGKANYVDYKKYLDSVEAVFLSYRPNSEGYFPYKDGMADLIRYIEGMTRIVTSENEYYNKDLKTGVISSKTVQKSMKNLYTKTLGYYKSNDEKLKELGLLEFVEALGYKYGTGGVKTFNFFIGHQAFKADFEMAHTSETYLAAMNSLTKEQLQQSRKYKEVIVNCPVDIEVYDSEGVIVGRISNNIIDESIESGITMLVDGDSKICYLPGEEQYEIRLTGNDNGTMDYSILQKDPDDGEISRIYYEDVPVEKDVSMKQVINSGDNISENILVNSDGEVIKVTKELDKNELKSLEVDVKVEGFGKASGYRNLTYGDYVLLDAQTDQYNSFIGWYDTEGNLLSDEVQYAFSIRESCCLIAKFTKVIPFIDVKESDYFYDPVLWAVENGITSGLSKTTFGPEATCTRAQAVSFLWRAAGKPQPTSDNNPFIDVKSGDYYYEAVLWAVENGVTAGTSATTFSPNANCTRGQIVSFIWRAEGELTPAESNNPFTDVKSRDYYYKAVLWAVENGVTAGTSQTTFSPNAKCTRGQIVTFLYRYMAQ